MTILTETEEETKEVKKGNTCRDQHEYSGFPDIPFQSVIHVSAASFRYSSHHREAAFGIGNGMVASDLVSEEDSSAGFENDCQQDSIIFF